MEPVIDFGDLVTGLQQLPEREKIILPALINAVRIAQNGELAKIERLVGQSIIAAARENPRGAHTGASTSDSQEQGAAGVKASAEEVAEQTHEATKGRGGRHR